MAKAVKGEFKCPKCDRSFSMAGHLGRHMSAIHGTKSARKSRRKKGGLKRKVRMVRRGRRLGRPKGISSKMQLSRFTIEELSQLIAAARTEARKKIAELAKALRY